MKHNPFKTLRHSVKMVRRTLRSYAMLSVTIVLSFSLLLGYLVWTDSSLYNRYKETFNQDRNIVTVSDQQLRSISFAETLKRKATEYGASAIQFDVMYFNRVSAATTGGFLEDGSILTDIPAYAISVPRHAWCIYASNWKQLDVVWLDGKEHPDYNLESGEIILDDRLYELFHIEENDNIFEVRMSSQYGYSIIDDTVRIRGKYKVVGIYPSGEPLEFVRIEGSNLVKCNFTYVPVIAFSAEDFNRSSYLDEAWSNPTIVFYSQTPENVYSLIRSMGISANYRAVYLDQNAALEKIRTEVNLKSTITAALLLILGINLYASFTNALNDRRFEIGVKRAIGASKWCIIRQFLYEGLMVMLGNILISIWLVLTVGLVYKVIYEHREVYGQFYTFTLTVTPYSVGMFAACSLTLTVVFSLVFAYKATQVQIIDYLKAE